MLDRTRPRRAFRRLAAAQLADLLGRDDAGPDEDRPGPDALEQG